MVSSAAVFDLSWRVVHIWFLFLTQVMFWWVYWIVLLLRNHLEIFPHSLFYFVWKYFPFLFPSLFQHISHYLIHSSTFLLPKNFHSQCKHGHGSTIKVNKIYIYISSSYTAIGILWASLTLLVTTDNEHFIGFYNDIILSTFEFSHNPG